MEPFGYVHDPTSGGCAEQFADQGPYQTCSIYALVRSIATSKCAFQNDIEIDIDKSSNRIAMKGEFKNRKGDLILYSKDGADMPTLVDQLQNATDSKFFLCTDGSPAKVHFTLHDLIYTDIEDIRDYLKLDLVTNDEPLTIGKARIMKFQLNVRGLRHYYQLAENFDAMEFDRQRIALVNGKYGSHFMHIDCITKDTIECINSMGDRFPRPIVPGEQWNQIAAIYSIHVDKIEVKKSGEWVAYEPWDYYDM